jgi:hypothetical protein
MNSNPLAWLGLGREALQADAVLGAIPLSDSAQERRLPLPQCPAWRLVLCRDGSGQRAGGEAVEVGGSTTSTIERQRHLPVAMNNKAQLLSSTRRAENPAHVTAPRRR